MPLHDRTALITGASKGLGKAMALALAEAGANVALVSRDEAKLNDVAKEIRDAGGRAEVFVADVTDEAQVARVLADFSTRLGRGCTSSSTTPASTSASRSPSSRSPNGTA